MTTDQHAAVDETPAFFVYCLDCERDPRHRWDRRDSALFDVRTDAERAAKDHDAQYHYEDEHDDD